MKAPSFTTLGVATFDEKAKRYRFQA